MCGKMRNSKFGRVRGIPHVREILDWPSVVTAVAGLWRVEGIKPRQEPRPGRGRYGARTRGLRRKGGLTMQGEGPKLCGGN